MLQNDTTFSAYALQFDEEKNELWVFGVHSKSAHEAEARLKCNAGTALIGFDSLSDLGGGDRILFDVLGRLRNGLWHVSRIELLAS